MKRTLFILVVLLTGYTATFAKQPQEPTSYNYLRGKELINNEDYEEGISVLQKEDAACLCALQDNAIARFLDGYATNVVLYSTT